MGLLYNQNMNIEEKTPYLLEFDSVLERLCTYAKTEQGKKICKELKPLNGIYSIEHALNCTKEAKEYIDLGSNIPIDNISDMSILEKPSYFIEEELIDFARTIRSSRLAKNALKESKYLLEFSRNLYSNKDLEDKIFNTFDNNNKIKKDATEKLYGLYSSLKDTQNTLREKVSELLNTPSFSKHLQENISTLRDERVVFQVKSSSKNIIDGIIHDISASNLSVYIEPKELISLNNKVRECKIEITKEEIRILTELSNLLKQNSEELRKTEKNLAEIDFQFAKGKYANILCATEPELISYRGLEIEKMRHPLLSQYVEKVVENDFFIGRGYNTLLITGANTGGKTVLLKTAGLFVLMCRSGLFVPAQSAKIYPFAHVFADIGDEQSIVQSLSTFSSHINNVIQIVKKADENTLVLLDEICSGTDPLEGVVLAKVILEKLSSSNVTTCVTTHFGELKELEYSNTCFKNASVMFDKDTLKPTYKLVIGMPGVSNAILICENLGLEKKLTDKAKELLVSQKDSSIQVVERLQESQLKLDNYLAEAEKNKKEVAELKKDYEKRLAELKKDKKKILQTLKHKFDKQIDEAKSEIKDIISEMRKEKTEQIARRSYSRLAKIDKNFNESKSKFEDKENYTEINWQNAKIGDEVLLKNLHQKVKILSLPDKTGNITVEMGLIKTKVNIKKLAVIDEKLIKKSIKKYVPKDVYMIERRQMSNTLDLRGVRVEEALNSLEYFLDRASLYNLTPVYVIHGHGTGILRKAVQEFLDESPYVAKHRFGSEYEGRDGVSVIDVN